MKKFLPYIIGVVIVAVGVGAYFMFRDGGVMRKHQPVNVDEKRTPAKSNAKIVDACIVMDKVVQQYSADNDSSQSVPINSDSGDGTASSLPDDDDIAISNCSLTLDNRTLGGDATPENIYRVEFTAQMAKTEEGISRNKLGFNIESGRDGVITQDSLGVPAFWNPKAGSLNILKNDNWYKISVMQNGNMDNLERALDIANKALSEL